MPRSPNTHPSRRARALRAATVGPGRSLAGFTLIEVLLAIMIIAVLIAILFPAIGAARSRGERTACTSNIHQVGMAMRSYLDSNNDTYPFASFMPSIDAFPVPTGETVFVADLLLPHAAGDPKVFACPKDAGHLERLAPNTGKSYFATEKSSYEFRSHLLGGQTMESALRRLQDFTGERRMENTIWIFRDYDNFHGQGGSEGARRYVYSDGHVTDFE